MDGERKEAIRGERHLHPDSELTSTPSLRQLPRCNNAFSKRCKLRQLHPFLDPDQARRVFRSPAEAMRISIVTATLNRARFLRRAIESVLAQGHDDVEHIIVDGMSTDGTVELLAGYSHLRVIREPDANMYEG